MDLQKFTRTLQVSPQRREIPTWKPVGNNLEKQRHLVRVPILILSILVGLADGTTASAQNRIQRRPSCDTVSIPYTSGGSTSVQVINLPYKVECRRIPGYEDPVFGTVPTVILYRYSDGGPKVDLLNGVALAKVAYAAEISSAQVAEIECLLDTGATWASQRAQCLHDKVFGDESAYKLCKSAADKALENAIAACVKTKKQRLLTAVQDADDEIGTFIDAYQGCENLDAEIESWQRYWAHLQ